MPWPAAPPCGRDLVNVPAPLRGPRPQTDAAPAGPLAPADRLENTVDNIFSYYPTAQTAGRLTRTHAPVRPAVAPTQPDHNRPKSPIHGLRLRPNARSRAIAPAQVIAVVEASFVNTLVTVHFANNSAICGRWQWQAIPLSQGRTIAIAGTLNACCCSSTMGRGIAGRS